MSFLERKDRVAGGWHVSVICLFVLGGSLPFASSPVPAVLPAHSLFPQERSLQSLTWETEASASLPPSLPSPLLSVCQVGILIPEVKTRHLYLLSALWDMHSFSSFLVLKLPSFIMRAVRLLPRRRVS